MNKDEAFNIEGDTLVKYSGEAENIVIPSGVKKIGAEAFAQNKILITLDLNEVEEIDFRAFYCCFNLEKVVARSVVCVGDDAFRACHMLRKIEFGKLERVGDDSFFGCMYLTEITGTQNLVDIGENGFNGTKFTHIDISPDAVRIGGGAFSCSDIISFTVPSGIKTLEACVFSGCEKLKRVTLPDGLERIENGAFFGCHMIRYIELPSALTHIGRDAFERCRIADICNNSEMEIKAGSGKYQNVALNAVHVYSPREGKPTREIIDDYVFCVDERDGTPYLLEYLGSEKDLVLPKDFHGKSYRIYRFAFCESDITSVDFGSGVEAIENLAFYNCENLKSVKLDGVKVIDRLAFKLCKSITSVSLDSIEIIGVGAFLGTGMQYLVVGRSVREIRRCSFDYCMKFKTVYYLGTPDEFKNVKISGGEGPFITRLTKYYSESEPTDTEHVYWHYDGDKIVLWD
ncbi:MAG: leucine-rich repeat domain-containing protein [Clostridiales bacterium]|nr:leucine-rich repeat domain-containing protein [Clostridiales bacterium]